MPQKTWALGEEVLATDFNTYVQQQIVARFATTVARDAAWPAAAAGAGAVCVTTDTGTLWVVNAGAWVAAGGVTPFVKRAGDSMTGNLVLKGAGPSLQLENDGAYIGFYNVGGTVRRGYLSNGPTSLQLLSDGGLTITPAVRAEVSAAGFGVNKLGTSAGTYDAMTVLLRDNGAAGTSRSVGMTFLNPGAYGPFWRVVEQSGERLEAIVTGGVGCASLLASAFTVFSTERFKENIEPVTVLEQLTQLGAKKYNRTTPLQCARIVGHDDDSDTPITELANHDCAVDVCEGTDLVSNPCSVVKRHNMSEYGLIAEEVLRLFPEAVPVDRDGLAEGVDLNQMLAIAIGAISELTARVRELEAAAA
jgi:hypothetical protein